MFSLPIKAIFTHFINSLQNVYNIDVIHYNNMLLMKTKGYCFWL